MHRCRGGQRAFVAYVDVDRPSPPEAGLDHLNDAIGGSAYSWLFHPPSLAHKRELEYAAGKRSSIEINGSFYSLQKPTSYQSWHQ